MREQIHRNENENYIMFKLATIKQERTICKPEIRGKTRGIITICKGIECLGRDRI